MQVTQILMSQFQVVVVMQIYMSVRALNQLQVLMIADHINGVTAKLARLQIPAQMFGILVFADTVLVQASR